MSSCHSAIMDMGSMDGCLFRSTFHGCGNWARTGLEKMFRCVSLFGAFNRSLFLKSPFRTWQSCLHHLCMKVAMQSMDHLFSVQS
jgi:hypothetical protein